MIIRLSVTIQAVPDISKIIQVFISINKLYISINRKYIDDQRSTVNV